MGLRTEALLSISEAVEIQKNLAMQRHDAFLPKLAGSLSNLSARQSELGDQEGAMKTCIEAVDLYRSLAAQLPKAFTPGLATSLNNLAKIQGNLTQQEAALASSAESVELSLKLVEREPRAFAGLFQATVEGYLDHLHSLGRPSETDPLAHRANNALRDLSGGSDAESVSDDTND